jgi:hypothetical protein
MNRSTVKHHAQLTIRFGNRLWQIALGIAVALTGAASSFAVARACSSIAAGAVATSVALPVLQLRAFADQIQGLHALLIGPASPVPLARGQVP